MCICVCLVMVTLIKLGSLETRCSKLKIVLVACETLLSSTSCYKKAIETHRGSNQALLCGTMYWTSWIWRHIPELTVECYCSKTRQNKTAVNHRCLDAAYFCMLYFLLRNHDVALNSMNILNYAFLPGPWSISANNSMFFLCLTHRFRTAPSL